MPLTPCIWHVRWRAPAKMEHDYPVWAFAESDPADVVALFRAQHRAYQDNHYTLVRAFIPEQPYRPKRGQLPYLRLT